MTRLSEGKYDYLYRYLYPVGEQRHSLDKPGRTSVAQSWVEALPIRMQSVLFSCVRGPDGTPKHGGPKLLTRWLRRCILVTHHDRRIYHSPWEEGGGGSFMRAWSLGDDPVKQYLDSIDVLPHHYQMHFLHAAEILAYRHPDSHVRSFWNGLYQLLVTDLHLNVETQPQFEVRYSDTSDGWETHLKESHLR